MSALPHPSRHACSSLGTTSSFKMGQRTAYVVQLMNQIENNSDYVKHICVDKDRANSVTKEHFDSELEWDAPPTNCFYKKSYKNCGYEDSDSDPGFLDSDEEEAHHFTEAFNFDGLYCASKIIQNRGPKSIRVEVLERDLDEIMKEGKGKAVLDDEKGEENDTMREEREQRDDYIFSCLM